MKPIETEYWKPHPDKPGYVVYERGRSVEEVFSELYSRLEATGYLPDEYFMLDRDWENGRTWPKDGYVSCTVDYGSNEGIYLDIDLKYQDEKGKIRRDRLITGKTLSKSDADMDRMNLIASAVTKAFNSNGIYSRYIVVDGEKQPVYNAVIDLNPKERKLVADSLLGERARLKAENKPFEMAERLLRRVIENISEYVRITGERPGWLDDYDRAALAIIDGDTAAFRAVLPNISRTYGSLLVSAAASPGAEGREMIEMLCNATMETKMSYDEYLRACKNAIDTNDAERVLFMLSKLNDCVTNIEPDFWGEVILHALSGGEQNGRAKENLAATVAETCTPEQLRGANSGILWISLIHNNRRLTNALLDRNIPITEPGAIFYQVAQKQDIYLAERLIRAGADVNGQNYAALFSTMRANNHAAGMFLLKLGADFEGFSAAVIKAHSSGSHKSTEDERNYLFLLNDYYNNNIKAQESTVGRPSQDQESAVPVGKIDYLGTDGTVGESIVYTDADKLEADIKRENYYGAPMKVTLYRDKDGFTVAPHEYIFDTDPPLQGFEIRDYDASLAAEIEGGVEDDGNEPDF